MPSVESLMDGCRLQPYVHDCVVTLKIGRRVHTYRIFFKNHKFLPVNQSILEASHERFKGDILVMSMNSSADRLINMRLGDVRRFDSILGR